MNEIAIILGKPIAKKLAAKFGESVVARWTNYRKSKFLDSFLAMYEEEAGAEQSKIDDALDKILADDVSSELLYDAYVRVCLSKSKDLGPRIIGILTAKLTISCSRANDQQESVFAAAERMSDSELYSFLKHFMSIDEEAKEATDERKKVIVSGDDLIEILDSNWTEQGVGHGTDSEITPSSLWDSLGSWAAKLEQCGLLANSMTLQVHDVKEDSERHIDYDQTWNEYVSKVYYSSGCRELAQLTEEAIKVDKTTEQEN